MITVVIPTYNEKENVAMIVARVRASLPEGRVFVVDDSSPDGTAEIVREIMKSDPHVQLLIREKKEGLGKAYMHAFREIIKDRDVRTVVMMDADFSHDPKYVPEMVGKRESHHVIVGSRYVKGGATIGWELWRRLLSFFGNLYSRIVTGLPIRDLTGGFNAIDADYLRKIDFSVMDMSGYAFQIELKYELSRLGAKFAEIPIVFTNRIGGESKISNHIIREGILAPWKIRLRKK